MQLLFIALSAWFAGSMAVVLIHCQFRGRSLSSLPLWCRMGHICGSVIALVVIVQAAVSKF
jgi:hypothetical protein